MVLYECLDRLQEHRVSLGSGPGTNGSGYKGPEQFCFFWSIWYQELETDPLDSEGPHGPALTPFLTRFCPVGSAFALPADVGVGGDL